MTPGEEALKEERRDQQMWDAPSPGTGGCTESQDPWVHRVPGAFQDPWVHRVPGPVDAPSPGTCACLGRDSLSAAAHPGLEIQRERGTGIRLQSVLRA